MRRLCQMLDGQQTGHMAGTQIDQDAVTILGVLAKAPRDKYVDRHEVARLSGLSPDRVNDAVALLVDSGYAEWIQTFGTAPFDFNAVTITSRGRYEHQRIEAAEREARETGREELGQAVGMAGVLPAVAIGMRPPSPIGSPYGFTDEDWETVAARKNQPQRMYTVLGHQFTSEYFDSAALRQNIETMLQRAVAKHNEARLGPAITLEHRALNAGYGEHLFNEIARDVIGSDIAIFETSDLNPNVMLEMGVALTWGVRVLPIKREDRPKPPSDVSGQTWADYRDHGATFVDPDHEQKLVRMIERAIRKKGRGAA